MGKTLAEKILARCAGKESVSAGEIIQGRVDIAMLENLSDGAVPYLAMLTRSPDAGVADRANWALYQRLNECGSWDETAGGKPVWEPLSPSGWRAYSIDGQRAQEILRGFAASSQAQEMYRTEQAW